MSTEQHIKESDVEQVFDPEEDVDDVASSGAKDAPKVDDTPIISEAERERWEKKRNVSFSIDARLSCRKLLEACWMPQSKQMKMTRNENPKRSVVSCP